jgi:osmotically-inducible protein OsmY
VVKNGNVTLTGVVANKMDSEMAYVRANGVHGAFSVTNELRVENQ